MLKTVAPSSTPPRRTPLGDATAALIEDFRARRPVRAGSLLTSVFGDAIAPHGGTVWLGSLIRALEDFGINQRLVRTSIFRLAKDGWLSANQIGRRSYYTLTATGRARFAAASDRIYNEPRQHWPGTWTLVLLSGVDGPLREEFRKTLKWLGYAPFSASLLAHPAADLAALEETLRPLPQQERVLVMEATAGGDRARYLRELVSDAFEVEALAQRYVAFLERFRPVFQAAAKVRNIPPRQAFVIRTLLLHEYRKILLRDPLLPNAMLPGDWPGVAAYQLCRNFYKMLAAPAEQYLIDHMETADGPLPPADPSFFSRFGGIA